MIMQSNILDMMFKHDDLSPCEISLKLIDAVLILQVLDTFSRCIIRSQEEADFDEVLTRDLVATLIDNHLDIFKVPETLKLQIDERIAHFKVNRIAKTYF